MDLNLERLNNLSLGGTSGGRSKKPPSTTQPEPLLEGGQYKNTPGKETATEELPEGLGALQRKAEQNKDEKDRSEALYRHYQDNIRRCGEILVEIPKGLREGGDIYRLFLKAVEAISCMTGNGELLTQAREDIKAIYGQGLGETPALSLDLEETQARLAKLREAETRETEADTRQRITRAIQAHEERIKDLTEKINKPKRTPAK